MTRISLTHLPDPVRAYIPRCFQPTIIHDRYDHTTPSDSLQPDRLHVNIQPLSTASLTTVYLGVLGMYGVDLLWEY